MKTPNLGLVFLIVILTAAFAVFITVVDGLRQLSNRLSPPVSPHRRPF